MGHPSVRKGLPRPVLVRSGASLDSSYRAHRVRKGSGGVAPTGSRVDVVSLRGRRWVWLLVTSVVVLAVALVGLVLVRSDANSHAPPFDLRTVGTACANDRAWVCGSIRVPVDRSSRDAGSLTVRFRVLPRRLTAKASSGTIVVVAGGPGDEAMNQYAWAQKAFRSLLADHDLLLVDNRGSGASDPIHCPKAEQDFSRVAVAQCRALLGPRADDYGTVAAVDDLEALLTRIHAGDVDLYGESYGTFFAQVFALRHPQHLARLVLDGALPLNVDPWKLDSIPTALAALRTGCHADAACRSSDPVALLRKVLARVRVGIPPDRISARAAGLASLLQQAGRAGSAYRELPAALRAYLDGDPLPLDRLKNEALAGGASTGADNPTSDGGLLLADTCADFPQPFDLHASLAVQKRQLDAAEEHVVTTSSRKIAPFTPGEALRGQDLCLGWPAPKNLLPPSRHERFPNIPTLVLQGALDTITPPSAARRVANEFRNGRYIQVPFVGHITARKDLSGCAASIAATFLASKPIDTDCLTRIPPPLQVEAFPTTFAHETPITPIDAHGTTDISATDLRTVAIARDVISDVMWRWGPLGFYSRHGLRGGTFTTIAPLRPGDYSVHLNEIRWTTDSVVTGDLITSPTAYTLVGTVVVSTPASRVRLVIQSPHILPPSTEETISGTFGGRAIDITVDAKFGV